MTQPSFAAPAPALSPSLAPSSLAPASLTPTPARPRAWVLEEGEKTIGMIVADGVTATFFAAHEKFAALDGLAFRSPREAEREIRKRARLVGRA